MSTATLVPCGGCHRHVRAHEPACPFCARPLSDDAAEGIVPEPQQRLSRAGVLAFAAAFLSTACPSREAPSPFSSADAGMVQTIYGGPPPPLVPPTPEPLAAPVDAATPPVDAATPPVDAATPPVDAATAPPTRPVARPHPIPHPIAVPAYGAPPPRVDPRPPMVRPGGSISTRYGAPPRPDDLDG